MKQKLILGSASPRRSSIMSDMGIEFDVVIPQVEEALFEGDPERTVLESAKLKNAWCAERYPDRDILTADTIVVFKGNCLLKPESMDEARSFLRRFSEKTQSVFTAVKLTGPGYGAKEDIVKSEVTFCTITEDVIDEYYSKVDPMDKSGAYDIDQYGDLIIESFSGSYSNIMGLPTELIKEWLKLDYDL